MSKAKIISIIVVLIVVAAAIVAAFKLSSKQEEPQVQQQQNQNQESNQSAVTGCPNGTNVTQTDANGRFKPTIDISKKVAVLNTSEGVIKVSLYDQDAPKTVENFVCLIQKGYYDGVTFHRVAKGFVIQAGDPEGTGAGGTSVYGPTFEDELYQDTPSYQAGYVKGVVAMANRGPNTNGSQFFITLDNLTTLPKNYTIFGKVISGMDVVQKIGNTQITPVNGPEDGKPVKTITITKATIEDQK